MDVKLFSLCKQDLPEAQTGKAMILECVKSFFPECEDFTAFASQKRMLLAVSQSLRAADVVIVAVQGNMYNATKRRLTAALDMKTAKKAAEAAKTAAKAAQKAAQATAKAVVGAVSRLVSFIASTMPYSLIIIGAILIILIVLMIMMK